MKQGKIDYTEDFIGRNLVHFTPDEISQDSQIFDANTGALGFQFVAKLREGSAFGEKGLDDGTPRTATVMCITDCDFACLLKKDYNKILKEVNREQLEAINEFFYTSVFKSNMSKILVSHLVSDFSKMIVKLPKGKLIFAQGTPDTNVYVIKEGAIVLEHIITTYEPQCGVELGRLVPNKRLLKICSLSKGEILGEDCLFRNGVKQFSAIVESDMCELYTTGRQTIKSYSSISVNVIQYFKDLYRTRKNIHEALINNLVKQRARESSENLEEPKRSKQSQEKIEKEMQQELRTGPKPKPVVYDKISDFETFDLKYRTELAEFVRKTIPSRDPKLAMRRDFEESIMTKVIPKDEIDEMKSTAKGDYIMKDTSYQEMQKMEKDLRGYRREMIRKQIKSRFQDMLAISKARENKSLDLPRDRDSVIEPSGVATEWSMKKYHSNNNSWAGSYGGKEDTTHSILTSKRGRKGELGGGHKVQPGDDEDTRHEYNTGSVLDYGTFSHHSADRERTINKSLINSQKRRLMRVFRGNHRTSSTTHKNSTEQSIFSSEDVNSGKSHLCDMIRTTHLGKALRMIKTNSFQKKLLPTPS